MMATTDGHAADWRRPARGRNRQKEHEKIQEDSTMVKSRADAMERDKEMNEKKPQKDLNDVTAKSRLELICMKPDLKL